MDSVGWITLGVFCVVALPAPLVLGGIIPLESKETQAQIELLRLQLRKAGLRNA